MTSPTMKELDDLLSGEKPGVGALELDDLLEGKPKSNGQLKHQEQLDESKGALKRQVQALEAEKESLLIGNQRKERLIKILGGACTLLALATAGMWLYARASGVRSLESAFKMIHYREGKALGANAIVLDEWGKGISQLLEEIRSVPGISEEERALRIRTCEAGQHKAEALRDGFLAQIKENDRERGVGAAFNYKDPFLKKEIRLAEENGGEIDLEKLKEEVKSAANLDATMKAMRESMLSPVPMAAQVKNEAAEQGDALKKAGLPAPKVGQDLLPGAGTPQLPLPQGVPQQ